MSDWTNSILCNDDALTAKLDELAVLVSRRRLEIENDDDLDLNQRLAYYLFNKFDDFYSECLDTVMLDI